MWVLRIHRGRVSGCVEVETGCCGDATGSRPEEKVLECGSSPPRIMSTTPGSYLSQQYQFPCYGIDGTLVDVDMHAISFCCDRELVTAPRGVRVSLDREVPTIVQP